LPVLSNQDLPPKPEENITSSLVDDSQKDQITFSNQISHQINLKNVSKVNETATELPNHSVNTCGDILNGNKNGLTKTKDNNAYLRMGNEPSCFR